MGSSTAPVSERFDDALRVARLFQRASTELNGDQDDLGALLVSLALEVTPACTWAGITAVRPSAHGGRTPMTLAVSDPLVAEIDRVQFTVGEGPFLGHFPDRSGRVSSPDLATETRWPRLRQYLVSKTPVRSLVSVVVWRTTTRLTMYAATPKAFDDNGTGVADLFAAHAHVLADRIDDSRRASQMEQALAGAREIGAAVGVVMVTEAIPANEAFLVLRRTSQDRNIKLRDVAAHVVETGRVPQAAAPTKENP